MSRLYSADRRSLVVGYRAVSGLLRISGAEDATGVLIRVVTELGGTTVPARLAGDDALPLDVSCGHGEPLLAVAGFGTAARVRLERMLPALIEDARIAVARADRLGRLGEQVHVDPLTGLLNRRAVQRLLPRLPSGDAVVVIDLDRFKQLNDTHGHAAGDAVLTTFSRLLREQGRAEDRYSRVGGEEFLGIYPATSVDDVVHGLDRLRRAWSDVAPLPVTFSAGVAAVGADGGSAAMGRADAAMYAAKHAGRDRTSTATADAVPASVAYTPGRRSPADDANHHARGTVTSLLLNMAASDVTSATELIERELDNGASTTEVVDLLAAAQEEVGRRWQSGVWSTADEHAATAIADAVLATLSQHVQQRDREIAAPQVTLTCPEGEWHQLPAQMFATQLVAAGVAVTMLGPSLPASDLQQALRRDRPTALALSCTLLTNLPAAEASIRAAHACSVPVLVGGRAFGDDSRRADRLGADGWAGDLATAVALLHEWQQRTPPVRLPEVRTDLPRLVVRDDEEHAILERIRGELGMASEFAAPQRQAIVAHVRWVVEHINAAVILGDDRIFTEFTEWLGDVLAARHFPLNLVATAYRAIDEVVCANNPAARRHLRVARSVSATAPLT